VVTKLLGKLLHLPAELLLSQICLCLQNCVFRRCIMPLPAELLLSQMYYTSACRTACFADALCLCLQNCVFRRCIMPMPAELRVSQIYYAYACRTACFADVLCLCLQKCLFLNNIWNHLPDRMVSLLITLQYVHGLKAAMFV